MAIVAGLEYLVIQESVDGQVGVVLLAILAIRAIVELVVGQAGVDIVEVVLGQVVLFSLSMQQIVQILLEALISQWMVQYHRIQKDLHILHSTQHLDQLYLQQLETL